MLALSFASLSADATAAEPFTYHLNICQPVRSSDSCVDYSQWGPYNACSSQSAVLECPLPTDYGSPSEFSDVIWARLTAYDRHSSEDVSCTIYSMSPSGDVTGAVTLSTGGSSAGHKTRTASGISLTNQFLRMRCTLPPKQAGNIGDHSHVTSMQMIFAQ